MTSDITEQLDGATIQHGPLSNRIYVMHPGDADAHLLPEKLEHLAEKNGYTKIIAKIPESSASAFLKKGYRTEAEIPGFFKGKETALFLGLYLDSERGKTDDREEIEKIIGLTRRFVQKKKTAGTERFRFFTCHPENAERMSLLYKAVFPTYPFPIDNPEYLRQTMLAHVAYFGVECNGELIALASSEMELDEKNVEMTDFATLPSWRGHGLAAMLLQSMESTMREKGFKTAYTIARALSPGMNITFARAGYGFCGTLINNTNISGGIESMNVWYKRID